MFKAPQTIPQDLLLIQGLVDEPVASGLSEHSDISSSSSEDSSEEEIAAVLTKPVNNSTEPSDSSSDTGTDSESSGSNEEIEKERQDFDEDEDPLPVSSSGNYFATKNEMTELEVTLPEIDQVGPDERLEKVGEIMTIVDRVVIVRGLPSQYLNHASERALDSDTLLVFDDRTVLGYIYETFGPTMQPLYQVKFSQSFPLDPERVRIGREVFHVPSRSKFVFVGQIKSMKGSDASNVNDEEPGDDELEFSDDEAESAYRNRLKRSRRGDSRHRSVASSRSTTPNPTLMRDDELVAAEEFFMSGDAYDEHGPYDIDYGSLTLPSSSRPTPTAYNDPYAESYNSVDVTEPERLPETRIVEPNSSSPDHDRPPRGRRRGNRDRGRGERGHHGRGRARNTGRHQQQMSPPDAGYFHQQEEYSPLYPEQPSLRQMPSQNPHLYYDSQPQNYLQPFGIQPHINPRFASAFGLSMYPPSNSAPQGYAGVLNPHDFLQGQYGTTADWTDEWSVPIQDSSADSQPETAH